VRFSRCPKCDYQDLPEAQAFPAECGKCGLILAKYRARDPKSSLPPRSPQAAPVSVWSERLRTFFLRVPERVDTMRFGFRCALAAGLFLWGVSLARMDVRTGAIASSFIHAPLLIFHEAGHVIFMVFGRFMMVLGGSLFQVLLPALLSLAFLIKNKDPYGGSVLAWFTGVSFMDFAPYVYDAQNPKLMLISGATGKDSFHDWVFLLDKFDWVRLSKPMGMATYSFGLALMSAALLWCGYLLFLQYKNLGGDVLDE
jgi:hypothetical protein